MWPGNSSTHFSLDGQLKVMDATDAVVNAEDPKLAATASSSLAEQHGKELQRYLARRLNGAQEARDLAQEVYLRLLRVGKQDLARDSPAYLYWIASHVVYEFKLRARRSPVTFDSEAVEARTEKPDEVLPDQLGESLSLRRELESALKPLPPTCRAVLLLHKRDGMSYEEVAKTLAISPHTVKKYVCRALAALRARKWER